MHNSNSNRNRNRNSSSSSSSSNRNITFYGTEDGVDTGKSRQTPFDADPLASAAITAGIDPSPHTPFLSVVVRSARWLATACRRGGFQSEFEFQSDPEPEPDRAPLLEPPQNNNNNNNNNDTNRVLGPCASSDPRGQNATATATATATRVDGTTSEALPRSARYLAPCLGAALSVSPLLGNLLRLGQRQPFPLHEPTTTTTTTTTCSDSRWSGLLSEAGVLANHLFFQLIRESPVHGVRNRSLPAFHLDPGLIGAFLAAHHHAFGISLDRSDLRSTLNEEFGIRSNRIRRTEWTGISVARWMDLAPWQTTLEKGINDDDMDDDDMDDDCVAVVCHQSLVSALWLIALWGATPSAGSWASYYQSLERAKILRGERGSATSTRTIKNESESESFSESDLAPGAVNEAMDRLLDYYGQPPVDSVGDDDECDDAVADAAVSRSMEVVCAAILLQQQPESSSPVVVPNGYYSFDGGATKADCAEVVVREILNLLLWNNSKGTIDPGRLPETASPELRKVLDLELDTHTGCCGGGDTEVEPTDLGQAWFELLSDLPECNYLAVSPNGRPYELTPTSESISKALWHILVGNGNDVHSCGGGDDSQQQQQQQHNHHHHPEPWTSLHDLAAFWSDHNSDFGDGDPIVLVQQDRLRHQSASASGGILEHEFLALQLRRTDRALEIRLRCDRHKASGMAAVTHLVRPRADPLLDPRKVAALRNLGARRARARRDPSWWMLCLALPSVEEPPSPLPAASHTDPASASASACLSWLATPYGPDRRELGWSTSTSTSTTDQGAAAALHQSRRLLAERILRACALCVTHPRAGAHLLSWILHESPVVVETSSGSVSSAPENGDLHYSSDDDDDDDGDEARRIEKALLALPLDVLNNDSILEAIEWNWAFRRRRRGRALVHVVQWKLLGRMSLFRVLSRSKLDELPEVASLYRTIIRRSE
eukprot:jgi/Psemu1/31018/gm1.31018_g